MKEDNNMKDIGLIILSILLIVVAVAITLGGMFVTALSIYLLWTCGFKFWAVFYVACVVLGVVGKATKGAE